MTEQQIRNLKADVLWMVTERVEDVFIDFQNAMEIKSGDISPLDALNLRAKEEQLSELIADVLIQQKGE